MWKLTTHIRFLIVNCSNNWEVNISSILVIICLITVLGVSSITSQVFNDVQYLFISIYPGVRYTKRVSWEDIYFIYILFESNPPGGRLNINSPFYQYTDIQVKVKTVSRTSYLKNDNAIPVKTFFYIDAEPRWPYGIRVTLLQSMACDMSSSKLWIGMDLLYIR